MTTQLPAEPHDGTCGARKKQGGGTCTQRAGWGTDHPGQGRCKLHGGATPSKHGRYSQIKRDELRDLIARHAADPDPLNILEELAFARALLQNFIERYDAWRDALIAWHESFQTGDGPAKPVQVLDIGDAYRILSEVTKIVERIERIRAANAITRPELLRLMTEMARVVERHVPDTGTLDKIRDGWLSLRVG